MSSFIELAEKSKAIYQELTTNGKKIVLDEVTEFFSKHPELVAFYFWQYTPGFNDGDPCYNSLVGPGLLFKDNFNDMEVSWESFREVTDEFPDEPGYSPQCDKVKSNPEISSWLSAMRNSTLLEHVYGTNKKVIFLRTSNGIECKEDYYDCGY